MRPLKLIGISCFAGSLLALAGCETVPTRPPPPRVQEVPAPEPPPPPPQQIYFYPTAGQTPAQQDRDRYECYSWAVTQTGFDPGRQHPAPAQRVTVEPATAPGSTTISGVATGAIVGAAVSRPGNAGGGALIGAIAGGLLGAAAENAQQAEAARIEDRANARLAHSGDQRSARSAMEYRRAMSACLEGRGYTVK